MSLTITAEVSPSATGLTSINLSTAAAAPLKWEEVASRRREEITSAIPPEYLVPRNLLQNENLVDLPYKCGILSPHELSITSLSATELLRLIHNETYTAVEVTTAFCKRAAIAHQAVRYHVIRHTCWLIY